MDAVVARMEEKKGEWKQEKCGMEERGKKSALYLVVHRPISSVFLLPPPLPHFYRYPFLLQMVLRFSPSLLLLSLLSNGRGCSSSSVFLVHEQFTHSCGNLAGQDASGNLQYIIQSPPSISPYLWNGYYSTASGSCLSQLPEGIGGQLLCPQPGNMDGCVMQEGCASPAPLNFDIKGKLCYDFSVYPPVTVYNWTSYTGTQDYLSVYTTVTLSQVISSDLYVMKVHDNKYNYIGSSLFVLGDCYCFMMSAPCKKFTLASPTTINIYTGDLVCDTLTLWRTIPINNFTAAFNYGTYINVTLATEPLLQSLVTSPYPSASPTAVPTTGFPIYYAQTASPNPSPVQSDSTPPVSAGTVAGATVGSIGFLSLAVLGMALWLRWRRSGRTVVDGDGEEEKEKQKEIVGAV